MLIFIICLLISIIVHEFGHMASALLCGVKVEVFSIGFWKPSLKKVFKGITFQITPFILGGYCKLKGENSKDEKDDFLAQTYRKKFFIVVAGVLVNLILACICYLLNYGSIIVGMKIDWAIFQSVFTQDYSQIVIPQSTNIFLLQLGFINLISCICNLIPCPALDGGHIWLLAMENIWKENFIKYYERASKIGLYFLIALHVVLVYMIWF